ncbi:exonuclease domain-containing protein [Alteromonas sp. ASW11-19]|uniref:DNA-directed DNA polymerase n=1 Tax=Alteromonas salexigens TaxID=2982530 RepID=A0ABT2VJQ4_9ALTE|nr:exonuclease domain-containing protein [Alteromonas salexigens]MCU7553477.1 exonuclease domain-containing protein [Alteromonas salexigens]
MRKTLPEKYYLSHFHEFLRFFEGQSKHLLHARSQQFIGDFKALPEDQQCIVARAANRKYAVVNRAHFTYEEIHQPQQQLDALVDTGWFGPLSRAPLHDVAAVLTKADIIELLGCYHSTRGLASATKPALASQLNSYIAEQGWPASWSCDHYLYCEFDEHLRFLLFLYFGNTRGRLNQFSMRDLGIMRTRDDSASGEAVARFDDADEASAAWYYAKELQALPYATPAHRQALAGAWFPPVNSAVGQQLQDKYCLKLGQSLLDEAPGLALDVLAQGEGDNAREKWLRELYKSGDKDTVKAELESIIDNPASDTLLAFAEDFYARKYHKKRTSAVTDMLRNASRVLALDESQNQQVERGVIAWYKRRGIAAWRTENRLWRVLFGLTFWELLYNQGALVNEFDRRPQPLRHNDFYARYGDEIEALLAKLATPADMLRHVTQQAAAHFGKVNSLFMWSQQLLETPKVLLQQGDYPATQQLLRMMCKDFASLRDGFPDIMVADNGLRFEEIKAPGDQLRRNQLISIQRLQQAGFDVTITQVNWVRDPQQPYAVVDIETTGGNASYHRITEVGIAKVVNGEIVDRWESLINPQRRIPSSITRLTGISDDMVADAPLFAEVADSIAAFTEDCVFVAHNVNFDYGFIKQEFARLEQPYRRPKLCTVREMRKAFPGLPSYSLAALTQHFGIGMDRHHRALSDANAAAALLLMTQEATPADVN